MALKNLPPVNAASSVQNFSQFWSMMKGGIAQASVINGSSSVFSNPPLHFFHRVFSFLKK
jgi:hypothetical protein